MRETTRRIRLRDFEIPRTGLRPNFRREDEWKVEPLGHVKLQNPSLALKAYILRKKGCIVDGVAEGIRNFVQEEVHYSGFGFLIHSEDFLNICTWRGNNDYGRIVAPQIYSWPDKERLDIAEAGAFSDGERLIYDFEANEWEAAMNHIAKGEDRERTLKNYLETFLVRE